MVRFLDDPGPVKLPLLPAYYTTLTGGVQGSWCLQLRRGRSMQARFKVTYINLEARMWLDDVQATTPLECFYPVFHALKASSSWDIRFFRFDSVLLVGVS